MKTIRLGTQFIVEIIELYNQTYIQVYFYKDGNDLYGDEGPDGYWSSDWHPSLLDAISFVARMIDWYNWELADEFSLAWVNYALDNK